MWSHALLCHTESVQVCPSKLESLSHDRNLAVIMSIFGWRPLFCAKTIVFQGVLGEVVGIVKLGSTFLFTSKLLSCDPHACGVQQRSFCVGTKDRTFNLQGRITSSWSEANLFGHKTRVFQVLKSSVLPKKYLSAIYEPKQFGPF